MKTCPRCDLENPSKANFCLACGAPLGDGILSEEIFLKKELEKANATIEVLKKSLASAQRQLENTSNKEQIKSLQTQIDEKNKEIEGRNKKILELVKSLEDLKSSKKGKWGWFFVVLFLVVTGVTVFLLFERDILLSENNRLDNNNATLITKNSDLETQIKAIQSQLNDDGRKMEEIVDVYPLIITNIEIANTYSGGDIETDYGNTLYGDRTMYLKPRIQYKGLKDTRVNFKVKWYNPDGTMRTGSSSPYGCSQSSYHDVYLGENQMVFDGWGNPSYGHWSRGTYRLEIWVGNICLKSKTFTIY